MGGDEREGVAVKTRYKYIHFEEFTNDKRSSYYCKNNRHGTILGHVEFYAEWKSYIFEPWIAESVREGIVFNIGCLQDIIHFMGQLKTSPNKGKNP